MAETGHTDLNSEEGPPVLGSWRNLYAVVLAALAALILLLAAFSSAFR
jgi:hypothetical protein